MYGFLDDEITIPAEKAAEPTQTAKPTTVPTPSVESTSVPPSTPIPNLSASKVMEWFTKLPAGNSQPPNRTIEVIKTTEAMDVTNPETALPPTRMEPNKDLTMNKDPLSGLEIVVISNDGALREEIEIELVSCDEDTFTGTLTMQEAKHGIYRDCLGFKDFSNFDGVRFAFKGVRIVAFKLKKAINVDSLIKNQHFEYKRRTKINNKLVTQIIQCKIKGLRSDALKKHLERKKQEKIVNKDGSVQVRITGCEYKVTEERLAEVLSHWGVLNSRITEEVFTDPHDNEGSNRTGIYIVKMKVHQHIPEWLPLDGLRVKVQYPGMKKLCNGCYGNHLRKDCNNEKLPWADYVTNFKDHNPEIPDEFYGKWLKKASLLVLECPTEKQFHLPSCKAEWDELKSTMIGCGIEESKIIHAITISYF